MSLVCSKCKAENRASAKYCKACGRAIKKQIDSCLEDVIGRDDIKATLDRVVKSITQFKKGWNGEVEFNKNMIITGNPGTGKTSLVHSIANMFFNENITAKGKPVIVDASEFEQFISDIETEYAKAKDGILFIDNFHKLVDGTNNLGPVNVDKLVYKMGQDGANPIVIVAGNQSEIDNYFMNNASAKNRFEHIFKLYDFTSAELYNICKQRIEKVGLRLNEKSANKLSWLFKYKVKTKDATFGNAHYALNVAEDITLAYYHRISFGAKDDKIIVDADITENVPKQKTLNEIFSELDSYIGLEKVKAAIRDIAQQIKNQRKLEAKGNKENLHFGFHMVLTGNPGTGKTMIVRKLGEVLSAINYLDRGHVVEVDKSKLVGQFIGSTPQIVQKKCDEAMGGILFIDEAYALAPKAGNSNQFGQEAIDTLLKRMEDDRDKFVVVAAGYRNEMQHFINANPGLRSRFDRFIHLEDYKPDELVEIFKFLLNNTNYTMSPEANAKLPEVINALYEKREKIFGNGREVRKLLEETIINLSGRVSCLSHQEQTYEAITQIQPIDFPIQIDKNDNLDDIFKELNSLVGLQNIKSEFEKLVAYIRVEKKRKELGGEYRGLSSHFVFMGNPGTGKTTVARLLGKIFKSLGLLSKGHLVEVDRSGLVAQYVGQTSAKTNEVIDSAMGGVLFIDEAYSLIVNESKNDFGQQAIQTLLKRMEDDADRFVVIAAGYPDEMDQLINSNPGLNSRFKKKIQFPDYNPDELFKIFKLMMDKKELRLTDEAVEKAKNLFVQLYESRGENFGNGRTVRNIFEATLENQSFRVARLLNSPDLEKDTLYRIEAEDIRF
ncbi:MAG: AAA family ATPase [Calditrichaceae bacterium]